MTPITRRRCARAIGIGGLVICAAQSFAWRALAQEPRLSGSAASEGSAVPPPGPEELPAPPPPDFPNTPTAPLAPPPPNAPDAPPFAPAPDAPIVRAEAPPPPAESADAVAADRGASVGLRVGYALTTRTRHFVASVPFVLDLGYRVSNHVYAGLYAGYAHGVAKDCGEETALPSDITSCSAGGRIVRGGLTLQYHSARRAPVAGWFGLGAGIAHETETIEGMNAGGRSIASRTMATRLLELLNLEAGIDFKLARALRIGPVATISISTRGPATNLIQAWMSLGIGAHYDL